MDLWSFSLRALGMCFYFSPWNFPTENFSKNFTNSSAPQNCILSEYDIKEAIQLNFSVVCFKMKSLRFSSFSPLLLRAFQLLISWGHFYIYMVLPWFVLWFNHILEQWSYTNYRLLCQSKIHPYLFLPLILQCSLTDANQLTDKSLRF